MFLGTKLYTKHSNGITLHTKYKLSFDFQKLTMLKTQINVLKKKTCPVFKIIVFYYLCFVQYTFACLYIYIYTHYSIDISI